MPGVSHLLDVVFAFFLGLGPTVSHLLLNLGLIH
jgi:hypothetical protein